MKNYQVEYLRQVRMSTCQMFQIQSPPPAFRNGHIPRKVLQKARCCKPAGGNYSELPACSYNSIPQCPLQKSEVLQQPGLQKAGDHCSPVWGLRPPSAKANLTDSNAKSTGSILAAARVLMQFPTSLSAMLRKSYSRGCTPPPPPKIKSTSGSIVLSALSAALVNMLSLV